MENIFDNNMKHEIIVLSGLKGINQNRMIEYFGYKKKEYYYYGYSDEEKTKTPENEKEILAKKNKLKNESLDLYYKIDSQKRKELESAFSQLKLKIKFDSEPKILKEGKFYILSKAGFKMYDSKLFNKLIKLIEIKFEPEIDPISAIQLENNDLVFACTIQDKNSWRSDYNILIYRLKDKQYFLLQKIKEGGLGYNSKYGNHGFCGNTRYKVTYEVENLKEISRNRFICISNYGFKIYSLNEKNEYTLVLINQHLDDIKKIYEINENKFIFCTKKSNKNAYRKINEILIEMIELNEITKEESVNKLDELKFNGYHINKWDDNYLFFRDMKNDEDLDLYNDELKKLIESLKLSCSIKGMIQLTGYGRYSHLSDYVILKNKYFIIMIDYNIYIFDIINGKELKRYEILIDGIVDGKDSLFIQDNMDIKKWNNVDDNEFVLFIYNNIILFELNEERNDIIKLKILNFTYFPKIVDIEHFQKLSEKRNKFYSLNRQYTHIISLY